MLTAHDFRLKLARVVDVTNRDLFQQVVVDVREFVRRIVFSSGKFVNFVPQLSVMSIEIWIPLRISLCTMIQKNGSVTSSRRRSAFFRCTESTGISRRGALRRRWRLLLPSRH